MARSVELWWLWRCGGCGVVISVGVNGFLFCFFFSGFAGICDQRCGGFGVVIGMMVFFFFFLFCFVDLG